MVVYCKMINSRDCCITESKTIGSFCDGRLSFCKFLSKCFASVLESAVLSTLIGLNKVAVLIPIVMGFSLLPIKKFDNFGSALWHSDKNRDGFSGLCWRSGVLLENDKRFELLASGISFIDGEHLLEEGHLAVV